MWNYKIVNHSYSDHCVRAWNRNEQSGCKVLHNLWSTYDTIILIEYAYFVITGLTKRKPRVWLSAVSSAVFRRPFSLAFSITFSAVFPTKDDALQVLSWWWWYVKDKWLGELWSDPHLFISDVDCCITIVRVAIVIMMNLCYEMGDQFLSFLSTIVEFRGSRKVSFFN